MNRTVVVIFGLFLVILGAGITVYAKDFVIPSSHIITNVGMIIYFIGLISLGVYGYFKDRRLYPW
jgi:hypothetical protein